MIEKADLTDKAVNQIAEIIKEPIKAKDKEIERLKKELQKLKKELQEEKEEKEHYQAIVESWE